MIALADCSPNNLINQAQLLRRVFCHFLCGDFIFIFIFLNAMIISFAIVMAPLDGGKKNICQ